MMIMAIMIITMMIMPRLPRTALVAEEFGDAIWGNHAGRQIACSDTASWWPPWSWWWWWWWLGGWRHFLGANKGESVVLRQIQCGTYCLAALNCPLSRDPTFIASELRSPIPPFCHQSTSSSSLNLYWCYDGRMRCFWWGRVELRRVWGESQSLFASLCPSSTVEPLSNLWYIGHLDCNVSSVWYRVLPHWGNILPRTKGTLRPWGVHLLNCDMP